MALKSTQSLTEMNTRNTSWGVKAAGAVGRADTLITFVCRLSWYLGTPTSRNSQGLFRPVKGLFFLLAFTYLQHLDMTI